ncbi:hypothetical protein BT67DRAFT_440756 [Trichocladium antarcticum]|uniref:Uncharacterized protein n=1 Tax=Trichocladium antarcticum TaxID=1450529 RepID=A0AAN6UMQ2_9PEZI|nr:hypothetical protein BT67DRAFT_440756 [Trichocladium antarcticum]
MVGILKFFWRGWIAGLAKLNLDPMTLAQQLWIAHTVGDRGFYWNLCKELLVSSWQWPNSTTLYLAGFSELRLDHLGPLQSLGIMGESRWPGPTFCSDTNITMRRLCLEQLTLGRRLLVNEVIGIFRFAMSNLTKPKPNRARCRSQESLEWKNTCDCAMLGALHRTLVGHQNFRDWHTLSEEESEKQILISVCQMVAELETIRMATIDTSRMRRHTIAHRDCTPWQQFAVKDILALHRVEDLVPIDEEHFKRQAEQSGIIDARANIIQPATNVETEQSRMNSTPSFSAGA